MKKTLLGLAAVGAMLVATSCSNEEFANPAGKAGKIQFNVGIEQSLGTRAMNDGSLANELTYAIYNAEGTEVVVPNNTANIENGTVSVTNELQAGKYLFVAWAQNEDCEAYDVTDLAAVEVDFDNVANNDEALDAFCGSQEFEVDGDGTVSVSLQRPFAQINFGWAKAVDYTTSAVEVTGMLSSKLNVVTGTVGPAVQTTLNFTANAVPTEPLGVTLNSEEQEFTYLAMSYVLVNQKSDVDYTITLTGDNGQTEYTVDNVPVQTNYRTNILGDVQSGEITFQVSINAAYAGDNLAFKDVVNVESISAIAAKENDTQTGLILTASYTPANATITSADFILTPTSAAEMMMRAAEDGVVTVEATAENGFLTAEVLYTALEPNATYTVTATATAGSYEPVESTPGESEGDVTVTVPDEEPTPEPEYPAHLYIVGSINGSDWTSSTPLELTSNTPGIYIIESVTLTSSESYFAFITQPLVGEDWDTFNANRYGPAENPTPLNVSGANEILKIGDTSWKTEGGTYSMTVDLKNMELTVNFLEALPTPPSPDEVNAIYVMGAASNLGWDFPGMKVTGENSKFIFDITAGSKFKFSINESTAWDGDGQFNAGAYIPSTAFGDGVYPNGQTYSLVNNGDDIMLPWTGDYTITVDLSSMEITAVAKTGKPTTGAPLYLRGDFSGEKWDALPAYELQSISYNEQTGGGVWRIDNVTIPAGGFKIADSSWGTYNYGNGTVNGTTTQTITMNPNGGNATMSNQFTGSVEITITSPSQNATVVFTPAK